MAVSKRTRFEVLRRDNYTCRYCRSTESDLTVDHVTPIALGGGDEPDNLVACCWDCNAGKSSTSPSAEVVQEVSDDTLRYAAAMRLAMQQIKEEEAERAAEFSWFIEAWSRWDEGLRCLPDAWRDDLEAWRSLGVDEDLILESLRIALRKDSVEPSAVFYYMRGVVRNKLRAVHERAQALIAAGEV